MTYKINRRIGDALHILALIDVRIGDAIRILAKNERRYLVMNGFIEMA